MHGEPMHSGIQDCWIEDVRCAAAPRTVTGDAGSGHHLRSRRGLHPRERSGKGQIWLVGEFNVGTLEEFLKERFPGATVKHMPTILTSMRAIKSPAEIAVMRKAYSKHVRGQKSNEEAGYNCERCQRYGRRCFN